MTFFPNSSGFIINGGNFNYYQTELEDGGRSIHFFFPSLDINDTKYSRNTGTMEKKKAGLGVRQFSEASLQDFGVGWTYGSVSMGDDRQASISFVLLL